VSDVQDRSNPDVDARTIVLVEGTSDQRALEALATRRGRDLAAEGISIVPMGGASNIRRFLERFGPHGANVRLAGLCDAAEVDDFRRELERAGLGSDPGRMSQEQMQAVGFFVCVADLEDELIRALGVDAVERVIDAQGEMGAFRTLQKQVAQQGVPLSVSAEGSTTLQRGAPGSLVGNRPTNSRGAVRLNQERPDSRQG
jgi:hypothetical protein